MTRILAAAAIAIALSAAALGSSATSAEAFPKGPSSHNLAGLDLGSGR